MREVGQRQRTSSCQSRTFPYRAAQSPDKIDAVSSRVSHDWDSGISTAVGASFRRRIERREGRTGIIAHSAAQRAAFTAAVSRAVELDVSTVR